MQGKSGLSELRIDLIVSYHKQGYGVREIHRLTGHGLQAVRTALKQKGCVIERQPEKHVQKTAESIKLAGMMIWCRKQFRDTEAPTKPEIERMKYLLGIAKPRMTAEAKEYLDAIFEREPIDLEAPNKAEPKVVRFAPVGGERVSV